MNENTMSGKEVRIPLVEKLDYVEAIDKLFLKSGVISLLKRQVPTSARTT